MSLRISADVALRRKADRHARALLCGVRAEAVLLLSLNGQVVSAAIAAVIYTWCALRAGEVLSGKLRAGCTADVCPEVRQVELIGLIDDLWQL